MICDLTKIPLLVKTDLFSPHFWLLMCLAFMQLMYSLNVFLSKALDKVDSVNVKCMLTT